jgi:alpha-amylase
LAAAAVLVAVSAVAVPLAAQAGTTPTAPTAVPAAGAASPSTKDVTAHLFQWPWPSVARECTDVLGPAGYGAVQVSPPQEHVELPDQGYPWWQAYQPVSYRLDSRYGDVWQFAAMVATCHRAGVRVYVDAVINHMTGQTTGGVGSAGTHFSKYAYPGLYDYSNFHHCGRNGNDWIQNWNDAWEIQNCELLGLADLATEQPDVQRTIAGYLNLLLVLGVDGFRIDAAKHIPAADLTAITARLIRPAYLYQEVLGNAPISKAEYLPIGNVIEDAYGQQLSRVFKSGKLDWLNLFGEAWGFSPGASAMVYVDSHDTERDTSGATLTYKDGSLYDLGVDFELAWPYGHPLLLSGYGFDSTDAGPPGTTATGDVTAVHCGGVTSGPGGWLCEDRTASTLGMVGFRTAVGSAPVTRWWSNGSNAIGFARDGRGYAVINRENTAVTRTFDTGLPAGTYCDVAHGVVRAAHCTGPTVTVAADGSLATTVPGLSALAIDIAARVRTATPAPTASVSFSAFATVQPGEGLWVVGGTPALGNWDPAHAVPLSPSRYPTWAALVVIPAGTTFEYKYIRKTADGTVTWENRPNRAASVPADGWLAEADGWDTGATVTVNITLHVSADAGQSVYLVGAPASLGSWDPGAAVPLTQVDATTWTGTATLPGSATVEFKYIRKNTDGSVVWESDPNRSVATPSGGTITFDDTWR